MAEARTKGPQLVHMSRRVAVTLVVGDMVGEVRIGRLRPLLPRLVAVAKLLQPLRLHSRRCCSLAPCITRCQLWWVGAAVEHEHGRPALSRNTPDLQSHVVRLRAAGAFAYDGCRILLRCLVGETGNIDEHKLSVERVVVAARKGNNRVAHSLEHLCFAAARTRQPIPCCPQASGIGALDRPATHGPRRKSTGKRPVESLPTQEKLKPDPAFLPTYWRGGNAARIPDNFLFDPFLVPALCTNQLRKAVGATSTHTGPETPERRSLELLEEFYFHDALGRFMRMKSGCKTGREGAENDEGRRDCERPRCSRRRAGGRA